jgi:hypothetical protein
MNQGRMTFTQIMDFASQDIFKVCVKRYNGNYKAKEFSCWKQFLCLAFGQLTHRESMALLKLVYQASERIAEKWTAPLHNWSISASQLKIIFGDRMKTDL